MGDDTAPDLTDEQAAALLALLDAVEGGDGDHAEAIARHLDGAGEDDEATDLDDATDLHDPAADYGTDET